MSVASCVSSLDSVGNFGGKFTLSCRRLVVAGQPVEFLVRVDVDDNRSVRWVSDFGSLFLDSSSVVSPLNRSGPFLGIVYQTSTPSVFDKTAARPITMEEWSCLTSSKGTNNANNVNSYNEGGEQFLRGKFGVASIFNSILQDDGTLMVVPLGDISEWAVSFAAIPPSSDRYRVERDSHEKLSRAVRGFESAESAMAYLVGRFDVASSGLDA